MSRIIGGVLDPAPVQAEDDWIVCLGETRSIDAGMVACPLRDGRPIGASVCAECHLLEWRHDERESRPSCTTGAAAVS